jgi:hypothetical protein
MKCKMIKYILSYYIMCHSHSLRIMFENVKGFLLNKTVYLAVNHTSVSILKIDVEGK